MHQRAPTLDEHAFRVSLASAAALAVAGGLVAGVNALAPFPHGWWLAAFLILVGGIAQALLRAGSAFLGTAPPPPALAGVGVACWNAGSVVVPIGVLVDKPAWVALGSIALLGALAIAVAETRGRGAPEPARLMAYRALILALAVSTVIGSALAHAPPGALL